MPNANFPPSAEQLIRELTQRIVALESAAQTRVQLDTITGGALQVQDAAGNVYVYMGKLGAVTFPDGSPQYGVDLIRQNGPESTGGVALAMISFDPGVTAQTLNMYDADGNLTYGDDGGGFGLARPYVSFGMCNANSSTWPSTTSATMADMWFSAPPVQHPKVYFQGNFNAPVGTSAQIQAISGSTVLGSPVTVSGTGGNFGWSLGPVAWPAGTGYGLPADLRIQACRTAGTGTVYVGLGTAYGCQT